MSRCISANKSEREVCKNWGDPMGHPRTTTPSRVWVMLGLSSSGRGGGATREKHLVFDMLTERPIPITVDYRSLKAAAALA